MLMYYLCQNTSWIRFILFWVIFVPLKLLIVCSWMHICCLCWLKNYHILPYLSKYTINMLFMSWHIKALSHRDICWETGWFRSCTGLKLICVLVDFDKRTQLRFSESKTKSKYTCLWSFNSVPMQHIYKVKSS